MTKITFVTATGEERTVEAQDGLSVMEVARDNGVADIAAECGGAMACATCHGYVDREWMEAVGPAPDAEREMLEFAATPPSDNSRLTCQIKVSKQLDGLVIRLPERQI